MTQQVDLLVKRPRSMPFVVRVDDELESYKNIVEGWLEHFYTDSAGRDWWCNDEGKLIGLDPNLIFYDDIIVGTIFIARTDEDGDMASLTDEDVVELTDWFRNNVTVKK